MNDKRPPEIEAEYRVVHGPWPRWAMQIGLARLALRSAAVVLALVTVAGLGLVLLLRGR